MVGAPPGIREDAAQQNLNRARCWQEDRAGLSVYCIGGGYLAGIGCVRLRHEANAIVANSYRVGNRSVRRDRFEPEIRSQIACFWGSFPPLRAISTLTGHY
jgi:hypothetical protein